LFVVSLFGVEIVEEAAAVGFLLLRSELESAFELSVPLL
jgi:hypothetical protein